MDSPPLTRPPPLFVGDHLALDFLNTLATPSGAPVEWLHHGEDLLEWLQAAGALDRRVAARFRGTESDRQALEEVTAEARKLREWFRRFVQRHAGRPLDGESARELGPLNRLLAEDDSYRQVAASAEAGGAGAALRWREERRWSGPDQLLQPIAAAIGDLVCSADFRLVRACEGSSCSLVFYDRTKGHRRRWCSMAACGNRAKAAAHRARQRRSRASAG
jgi:predicted RNA-binding Zn ribbon-like protein